MFYVNQIEFDKFFPDDYKKPYFKEHLYMGNFYWEKTWPVILAEQEKFLRYPA